MWSATGLPNGLAFHLVQGFLFLNGTPASGTQGTYNPVFTVKDAANSTSSITLPLTITSSENPPLQIATPSVLPPSEVESGRYFLILSATGQFVLQPFPNLSWSGRGRDGHC